MYSESSNIGLVVLDFLLQAYAKKTTTKPILLDSLYTVAAMCSKSSNIGLVVLDFLLQGNAKKTNKPILLDSHSIEKCSALQ
jgi:hypothetical protein